MKKEKSKIPFVLFFTGFLIAWFLVVGFINLFIIEIDFSYLGKHAIRYFVVPLVIVWIVYKISIRNKNEK